MEFLLRTNLNEIPEAVEDLRMFNTHFSIFNDEVVTWKVIIEGSEMVLTAKLISQNSHAILMGDDLCWEDLKKEGKTRADLLTYLEQDFTKLKAKLQDVYDYGN